MIGQWLALVIDCADPRRLAAFYEVLLGMDRIEDEKDWVSIAAPDREPRIAFQRVVDYVAPTWPNPPTPQQMHFDVEVDDLDDAAQRVIAMGARLLEDNELFRIFADPAGHPFCLALPQQAEHYRAVEH
ncbi:MAG: VOC family protein [Pseudonocardiaceae bacterium]|nr:VOC family protein [Pseudonocardiaceae bacterium]